MMNKCVAILVVLGVTATAVVAGPMGPVRPSSGRWGLEIEGSRESREFALEKITADKYSAENTRYLSRISYGVTDNMELSVRFGADQMDIINIPDVNPAQSVFFGSNQFAWGLGIGTILYDGGIANLACQATWLSHSNHTGVVAPSGTGDNVFDFTEWQIGMQVQGQFGRFLPYIGTKYSDAQIKNTSANRVSFSSSFNTIHSDQNVGAYGGAMFDVTSGLSLYVEAHGIDESSFGAGMRYSFGGMKRSSGAPSMPPVTSTEQAVPMRIESSATPDALHLNDGSILRGRIINENRYAVTIESAGTQNEIPQARIHKIVRGNQN